MTDIAPTVAALLHVHAKRLCRQADNGSSRKIGIPADLSEICGCKDDHRSAGEGQLLALIFWDWQYSGFILPISQTGGITLPFLCC
jgi:hypothetical protein